MWRSPGEKRIPLSAPLCPFRVLVGMDPYHHAQLLLCLPTPEGQDASPAGTAATWDQPDGLPGSLEFPHLSPATQSEWVNLCVWLCFVDWESLALWLSSLWPVLLEERRRLLITQIRISKLKAARSSKGEKIIVVAAYLTTHMLIKVLKGFLPARTAPSSVMSQK